MSSARRSNQAEIRRLLESQAQLPARLVEALMASRDREEQADAYFCLSERWDRIHPEMEVWFTAPFVLDFLFRSMTDPCDSIDDDSYVLSSYDAARELLGILRRWNGRSEGESVVAQLTERMDRAFLAGDQCVQDCIETGFLEHALEYPELRPLFAHWPGRLEMSEAYARALEWGLAHEHRSK
jgi:hypothetical protein